MTDLTNFEILNSLFLSVSALAAAAAFIFSVYRQAQKQKKEELFNWQMVVIQKIFQKHAESSISFDNVIQLYRSEASALQEKDITSKDLSESSLRAMLIKLVRMGVIKQCGNDHYKLNGVDPGQFLDLLQGHIKGMVGDQAQLFSKVQEKMDAADKINASIFTLIDQSPNEHSKSDIILRVSESLKLDTPPVTSALIRLIADRTISINTSGKLSLTKTLGLNKATK